MILDWIAISFSRGTSWLRNWTQVSCTAGRYFTTWATREASVTQSCPTLCNPVDCSLPGSSVHGILQARILEWVAISFSRGSSWLRDQTQVSRIAGRCLTLWTTREAPTSDSGVKNSPVVQGARVWPLVWEDPQSREWLPTPVFLPRESHGKRSLEGYSPWGHKESDTTEWLSLHYGIN